MNMMVKTNVIKRNGEEVTFDLSKISNAISAANNEVDNLHRMNEHQIKAVAQKVADQIEEMSHAVHVEDIQDMVETGIMEMRGYEVAQKYVRYRYKRELTRKSNTTDNGILALIENINEEFGLDIKESDAYHTLGGFILDTLGALPAQGETFESGSLKFTVMRMATTRIELVKVEKLKNSHISLSRFNA